MGGFFTAGERGLTKEGTALFCALTKALKRTGEIRITEAELSEFYYEMMNEGGPIRVLSGTDLAVGPWQKIYRVRLRKQGEQGILAPMPKRNRVITLD